MNKIKIYYNPKVLLASAGMEWLWDVVFIIILVGLTITFVTEVFKLQNREKPDFKNLVWKAVMILILYRYLPDMIEQTMDFANDIPILETLDAEFYKTFSLFSANLSQTQTANPTELSNCPEFVDISLNNAGISFVTSFYFQYFAKLSIFALMLLVWVSKEVIFSYTWSVLMSLNMIGLCSALVIPAFPNQGFGSVGSFFKSTVAFAMWPILYSIFIFITGPAQIEILKTARSTLVCPHTFEIGSEAVATISGLIFISAGIVLIPLISDRIICSEQVKSAVVNIKNAAITQIDRYRAK